MNDQLLAPARPVIPTRCTVCKAVKQQDDTRLADALANPEVPSSNIAKWLQGNGFHILATTVRRHRNGECRGV